MWRGVALTGAAATAAALALSGTALAASGPQISVNGTGSASVPDGATDAQQQAAYDQALGAAITNAQAKAQAVAKQLTLTLGQLEIFTEESDDYLGYCGVGFLPGVEAKGVSGSADAPTTSSATTGELTKIPAKPKKHKAKKKAHKAQSTSNTCEIEADVTVVYAAT